MNLVNCKCDNTATFKKETERAGHGANFICHYVSCECGMRTKSFAEHFDGTKEQCKALAANIWNKHNI